ncbi:DUF2232 domain-containing protein [Paenibacillaceae bacterium]|nr:DUF2232 domain-containing protein [Paenibacillaceae bacterium]
MKTGLKSLLWSGAALVLLLSVMVPVLNVLAFTLIMVPFVMLFTLLPKKVYALHVIPVFVIAYVLLGPASLVLGLFFLVPSIVMGHMYKRQAQARTVLTVGILTVLAQFLLEIILFQAAFNISLTAEMSNIIRAYFEQIDSQNLLPANWTNEFIDMFIRTLIQSVPYALIAVSFVLAVVTHAISRRTLRSHGFDTPGLKPAKEWMLPKILVMYYLVAIVLEMFISSTDDSFMAVVLINLIPLLRLAFTIQSIGFFFFLAHQKGWNRAVPILLTVPVLLFPPLSLIGVLDIAFPIRKSLTKS